MNEKLYQLALELTTGIGDVLAKNLIAYCGSASEVYKAKNAHLRKIPGIGDHVISLLKSKDILSEAEAIITTSERKDITILHYTDAQYPDKLKQVADAPNIIYARGTVNNWNRVLAIVGTRRATDYGKSITEEIVAEAKALNVVIVSGLAYGIDITSHRASLKNNIPTIGVLAGGLDRIYPSAHKSTATEMLTSGGLISENPPGTKPDAHYFPARNRIIAGMSDAVIVVEAAKKGGALITANIADSYNKPVFAVPGDLKNEYSVGCNHLIRNQKALIYTGTKDLMYHLNWEEQNKSSKPETQDLTGLSEVEKDIYRILSTTKDGVAIDDLSWKAQIPINKVATLLLNMEFLGFIKSLPGKKYKTR